MMKFLFLLNFDKRILSGLIFTVFLIGFSFNQDVSAIDFDITNHGILKGKGMAMCETEKGDFCGASKINTKFKLTSISTTVNDVSGIAQGKIVLKDAIDAANEPSRLLLKDLSWTFDKTTNTIFFSGVATGAQKSIFKVEIKGWFLPEIGDEVFLRTTLTSSDGNIVTGFISATTGPDTFPG